MNEIQLLRDQLALERRHVREVASAAAAAYLRAPARTDGAPLEPFGEACTEYLGCVLEWFDRRDERLGGLVARLPVSDARRQALEALGLTASGRTALATLTSGGAREAWAALADFVNGAWDARRGAIEALLAASPRVTEWRAFAGIDADSVYRERALYALVRAALPAGVELTLGGGAGASSG